MSLATDSIFIAAIQSNTELMEALGYEAPEEEYEGRPGRLYGTAIPLPDEDADNTPVPYIIVTFDGQVCYRLLPGDEVVVRKSEAQAEIIKFEDKDYYQILRTKLWRPAGE